VTPVCALEDFQLTRLNIEWHDPGKAKEGTFKPWITYDVLKHAKDASRYLLTMMVDIEPVQPPKSGYEIHATIRGEFSVTLEPGTKTDPAYLVRLNGLTMLYGLLRGQVAQTTGSFPWGKFVLPAMMMQDVITSVEEAKRKAKPILGQKPETKSDDGPGPTPATTTKRVKRLVQPPQPK
jgi:hypothetical protein